MKQYTIAVAAALLLGSAMPALADDPHHGKTPHGTSMFDEMDTNHDGAISKEEFMASAEKRFNEIDTNHDGKLTHEEVDAYHKKQMEKFTKMREEMQKQQTNSAPPAPNMMPSTTSPSKAAPSTMAPTKAAPSSTAPGY